jgi:hypothetical protein
MFSEHLKAKYWSNKNLIKPNEVALNSHKKFWFDCGECAHDFEISLLNINQSNKHKNVQHARALQAPMMPGTIVAEKNVTQIITVESRPQTIPSAENNWRETKARDDK